MVVTPKPVAELSNAKLLAIIQYAKDTTASEADGGSDPSQDLATTPG